jgi:hypothetical protein
MQRAFNDCHSGAFRMKAIRLFAIFTCLYFTHHETIAQNAAGKAGAFLRIGAGARALALGGAFSAISDDPSAGYWNPAGLSHIDQIQFTATHYKMSLDRNHNFIGGALPITSSSTVGLSWIGLGVNGIEGRTGNTAQPDFIYSNSSNALLLSFGQKINSFLSVGFSAKGIYQKLQDVDAYGMGFDVSMLARPNDFVSIGFSVQDLGTRIKWSSGREEAFPLTYRGGIALNVSENLLVAFDAYKIGNGDPGYSWGAEYKALNLLPIRVGYSDQGIVAGAGINVPLQTMNLAIDYAFGKDQLDGSESHKLSLGFAFFNKRTKEIDLAGNNYRSKMASTAPPLPNKETVKNNQQVYLKVLAKGLNVRTGPGVKNKRVAVIYRDQQFRKMNASGYWYKIELAPGKYGWVHHKYVEEILK